MVRNSIQARDLLKISNILKGHPEDTLNEALAKLSRSHDALFVFNDDDEFLGLISPYYVVFKTKFPPDTKLKNALFHPPRLSLTTTIWDIAKLMAESKVYFLPVFDKKNNFVGIVTINNLLQKIEEREDLPRKTKLAFNKNLITISKDARLDEAYRIIRERRTSRLPVVDSHNHLCGIITRHDLQIAVNEPRQKPNWLSRRGDKDNFLDRPLENYYKKMVLTASPQSSFKEILQKMIKQQVGSVVIVNTKGNPIGIISNNDVLKIIAQWQPEAATEIKINVDDEFEGQARIESLIFQFVKRLNRFNPITRLEFILEGEKNPSGKTSFYKTKLHLNLKSGKRIMAQAANYDWKKAVHEVVDKIKHQLPEQT